MCQLNLWTTYLVWGATHRPNAIHIYAKLFQKPFMNDLSYGLEKQDGRTFVAATLGDFSFYFFVYFNHEIKFDPWTIYGRNYKNYNYMHPQAFFFLGGGIKTDLLKNAQKCRRLGWLRDCVKCKLFTPSSLSRIWETSVLNDNIHYLCGKLNMLRNIVKFFFHDRDTLIIFNNIVCYP